jgi:hypothetical protein
MSRLSPSGVEMFAVSIVKSKVVPVRPGTTATAATLWLTNAVIASMTAPKTL